MKNKHLLIYILTFITFRLAAQSVDLNYYLPDISYDKNIPTPQEFLGHQIGDWHITHDQLYFYLKTIAEKSNRVELQEYARSHENRPLVVLKISSQENIRNLEQIRKEHLDLIDPSSNQKVKDQPIIIYQGYSIHGNESSGANAAALNAYYLAAGQSPDLGKLLKESVILLDPCYNPDGLQRFSTWANMHKSEVISSDPSDREYNEVWPRGRTNHYWFDLNRDWLLLTHPESRGRIGMFHDWMPNILTDHHEMGTNSTFFFQPGIPSRTNPNTPKENQQLTEKIARYHAAELDKLGSMYYAKESFDDFYYGKGSTYPDAHGCIGILFEQASSRGHLQESRNGLLSFPFTIRNQVATSISTQKAAIALRKDLLNYQKGFYKNVASKSTSNPIKAYVFSEEEDKFKLNRFIEILEAHHIDIHSLASDATIKNKSYKKNHSFVVKLNQKQYTLTKSIFEKVKTFEDSLFYDVSAWTLPLAFNLNYSELKETELKRIKLGDLVSASSMQNRTEKIKMSNYAYIIDWRDYNAPLLANKLLSEGIRLNSAQEAFTINIEKEKLTFPAGTLVVPVANQNISKEAIYELLNSGPDLMVDIYSTDSSWSESGVFLGSPNMRSLRKPEILLLVGQGVNSYEAGSAWHQLDKNFKISITKGDITNFSRLDLTRYNTIIMPDGSYSELSTNEAEKLEKWIGSGGNLVSLRKSINYLKSKGWIKLDKKARSISNNEEKDEHIHYGHVRKRNGSKVIGGSIFKVSLDQTHPLCFGYTSDEMYVFRRGTDFYKPTSQSQSTPIRYVNNPLQSGYMHRSFNSAISNSGAAMVFRKGGGQIICLVDNPNFRGYWWGGSKLFANAIMLGHLINP